MKLSYLPLFVLSSMSCSSNRELIDPCELESHSSQAPPLYQYEVSSEADRYYLTLVPLGGSEESFRFFGVQTTLKISHRDEVETGDPSGRLLVVDVDVETVSIDKLGIQLSTSADRECSTNDLRCSPSFDSKRGVVEFDAEGEHYELISCYGIFSAPFLKEVGFQK